MRHMLPYGTGISRYAFIWYFQFAIVSVHSFLNHFFNTRSKQLMVAASPNLGQKGRTFGLSLYVSCLYDVHILYCIPGSPTCVRFELVKRPEVTLCG